jgi:hypothetical protein
MGLTVLIIWTAIGVSAGLAVVLLYVGLFQDRSRGRPRCPKCWYNMTGAPSLVCPECGHNARSPKRFYRTRRRRWAIVAAVLVAACCYYSWLVRVRVVELKEPVPVAMRPTSYLLVTLPDGQRAQIEFVNKRIRRFGIWPWEERLLLIAVKSALSAFGPPQPPREVLLLLSTAAETSDWSLDRLTEMGHHPNPYVATWALRLSAQFAIRLTDEQIISLVKSAIDRPAEPYSFTSDPILLEMVRRKKPAFRELLARWSASPPTFTGLPVPANVEVLTALRRMEGKNDPLEVFVVGPRIVECTTENLPTIEIGLRNVDEGRRPIGFIPGKINEHIRGGWCLFDVRDEQGCLQPVHSIDSSRDPPGGRRIFLRFGESINEVCPLRQYLCPLRPGRYRVTVFCSESPWIIGRSRLSDTIVFRSDPFELIVKPAGNDSRPAAKPQYSLPAMIP